jgi:hypothetical protein
MLKGKMEFRLGSEQRVCDPGDVVVIREVRSMRHGFAKTPRLSISSRLRATTSYSVANPPT